MLIYIFIGRNYEMKQFNFKKAVSVLLTVIIAFGCLSLGAFAAEDAKIVTPPPRTDFYEGIDWYYNRNGKIVTYHDLEISGVVLEYNSKQYPTREISGFGPNVYAKSLSGSWQVGKNQIKIYNFDIPDSSAYAVTTVNFVKAESISLVTRPDKTILLQDKDWQLGILGDVEIKDFDTTGTVINVTFTNGDVKTVSAENNKLLSWSVPREIDVFEIGPQDLYITYGNDAKVAFGAFFATDTVHCPGDVNIDNTINSFDALRILQASVGSKALTAEQKALADVTDDGSIDSLDALKVLQYSVGKIQFIYK